MLLRVRLDFYYSNLYITYPSRPILFFLLVISIKQFMSSKGWELDGWVNENISALNIRHEGFFYLKSETQILEQLSVFKVCISKYFVFRKTGNIFFLHFGTLKCKYLDVRLTFCVCVQEGVINNKSGKQIKVDMVCLYVKFDCENYFIVICRPKPYGLMPFCEAPWFVPIWKELINFKFELNPLNL